MNDSELSLAVAKIIWPDYDSKKWTSLTEPIPFDYTTDDALGKMCKWLAKSGLITGPVLYLSLLEDNPHKTIAEAIVATNET